MHTYADMEGICKAYARHMQAYASIAYASICKHMQAYASICKHMQAYVCISRHMQGICKYMHYICEYIITVYELICMVYAKICSQYNTEHMQNIKCRTYASSTQEYARICIL